MQKGKSVLKTVADLGLIMLAVAMPLLATYTVGNLSPQVREKSSGERVLGVKSGLSLESVGYVDELLLNPRVENITDNSVTYKLDLAARKRGVYSTDIRIDSSQFPIQADIWLARKNYPAGSKISVIIEEEEHTLYSNGQFFDLTHNFIKESIIELRFTEESNVNFPGIFQMYVTAR